MFTQADLDRLEQHGITLRQANEQMQRFKTGFPVLDIVAPAAVGKNKGIRHITREQQEGYITLWQNYLAAGHTVTKFVPASGAASRMFKDLYQYLETGSETPAIREFLDRKADFAFGDQLVDKEGQEAVRYLLEELHYGDMPKGVLPFHRYKDGARTPVEEHMVEGVLYATTREADGQHCRLHFTVSEQHMPLFRKTVADALPKLQKKYGVLFDITFSTQSPKTDTLAANPDGTPFRQADGSLLFRPGGHGALIDNLNAIDSDIIFLKNIDNVVPDRLKRDTVRYKQVLAGVLIEEQERGFNLLRSGQLSQDERARLSRPIRVCGVVKNTGEPGGGPFIVREKDGSISYQILESTQVPDPQLLARSTHFNPVDLVCAVRDVNGHKYNLPDYVDPDTGFISRKSKDGKELLAMELPGLWNGAMAGWNTLFVEVPVSTFNPVKTVNDLLRKEHQPR